MCRFVAYSGAPLATRTLVFDGAHSLARQSYAPRELLQGTVNADGYGIAWYEGATPYRIRETRPIWHDPDLEGVLAYVRSSCVLAVVRNATLGIPVDRTGLAPLVVDRWTFALNGFVQSFRARAMRRLREPLSDALYARIEGASDTETLFLLALSHVEEGATPGFALARVVEHARAVAAELGLDVQLNMVLSDGERIAATRTSGGNVSNSLYVAPAGRWAPEGVVLASEPLDGTAEGWAPVPHDALVEMRGGSAEVTPLG